MTGAEHYALAEQLLREASSLYEEEDIADAALPALVGRASAHATLALAAAADRQNRLAHGDDLGGYGAELTGRAAVR